MYQLGGHAIYLSPAEIGLGKREPVRDIAAVLSRYVNGIVVRTFSQNVLMELASASSVPVINGLSDEEHPCQALGDFLTIFEKKGTLKGINLTFVGDGNNVASSLLLLSALMGVNFRIACPPGYEPPDNIWKNGQTLSAGSGARIQVLRDPEAAVHEADVIYTDVWTSMGQEAEVEKRRAAFKDYQVNSRLLSLAKREAILMHPMPVHHGEELEPGLVYSPQSVLFDEAENRLHIQKAILTELLAGGRSAVA
jgi:ornithine carbamoyltransferase